jgi:hypothetical protein
LKRAVTDEVYRFKKARQIGELFLCAHGTAIEEVVVRQLDSKLVNFK